MDESKFGQMLADAVTELLPQHKKVKLNVTWKNNDVVQEGICIMDENTNVAPTIYVDTFYERYQSGMDIGQLAKEFLCVYENHKVEGSFDISFYMEYEKVRERIVFKLINRDMNRQILGTVPHKAFMDLEIVFYYLMEYKESESATILVQRPHMEMWGVTEDDLWECAKRNTPRLLPVELIDMGDMFKSLIAYLDVEMEFGQIAMHILTNRNRFLGAAVLLYDGVVREFAMARKSNVYIIPSSIHETILILDDGQIEAYELNQMVKEINATQVDRKEVLANHVYYYDYQDDILTACIS